ncbi:DUF2304 domain-containing protein [uncultured Georgenia sp.]|uniref:DUF2304 domain-containing protein n=1 Tax=uncultured Georgenia sp. TaxID=378209 RepID=UPI002610572D|nr:DUF2304 domain-containing protein [uncultured Georgenia sp.]HLV05938.1 DUF2304 domain-containing protein [Actinomycetaceae bacterium]
MSDQIVIQVLLLAGVGVVAVMLTRTTANARHQAIRRILLVAFVLVAAASVVFPDWLTWLARRVGVGRGADLLLYSLVIAFLGFIATSYRRLGELERKITVLTRELALTRARLEGPDPRREDEPQGR